MKRQIFLLLGLFFYFTSAFAKTPPAFVLIGPPGCGKGAQSQILTEKYPLCYISTGDVFRDNIAKKTNLGRQVTQYLDKGQLVPDEIVMKMLSDEINKMDCKYGIIIDGSSRTLNQAKLLYQSFDKKFKIVPIIFEINDQVIIDRVKYRRICSECNTVYHTKNIPPKKKGICDKCRGKLYTRKDDNEEVIKNRLKIYHKEFDQMKPFYDKKRNVYYINADDSVDNISKKMEQIVSKYLK